jgi:glutamine synthetase
MTKDVLKELEQRGIDKIKVGGFDVDGILRGKYISIDKLRSALGEGFGFCDVIFGWDLTDQLYDNASVTGWHTGYPDAHAALDPSTLRYLPWEPGVAAMLCDFRDEGGRAHPACPRSLLKSVLERADKLGFSAKTSCEFEFWLFKESSESAIAKDYRDLVPVSRGMYGYSWVREGQNAPLMRAILDQMKAFDIEIEALHTETGPGVYEVAIRYDDALRSADKAALFKTAMKQVAHDHGLSVTFMAKWNADLPGSSGHLHQSLWKEGRNVFADASDPAGMSRTMRSYMAGLLALAPELTALYSPTINSYKRYVPGVWAPLTPTWGVENRTAAVRVISPGHEKSCRIEYRQTAADINPYIAMATCIGAGLYGIEHELVPPPASAGDASDESAAQGRRIPRSLHEATELLAGSAAAREILGEAFVDHYVRTRRWEVRQFERAVTSWELRRYFEAV